MIPLSIMAAASSRNVLYSAYFCPYAQRVWAALNELELPFQLVESLEINPVDEFIVNPFGKPVAVKVRL